MQIYLSAPVALALRSSTSKALALAVLGCIYQVPYIDTLGAHMCGSLLAD